MSLVTKKQKNLNPNVSSKYLFASRSIYAACNFTDIVPVPCYCPTEWCINDMQVSLFKIMFQETWGLCFIQRGQYEFNHPHETNTRNYRSKTFSLNSVVDFGDQYNLIHILYFRAVSLILKEVLIYKNIDSSFQLVILLRFINKWITAL